MLDRRPQFVTELTKELNRMLDIETKLPTAFHSQTCRQTKQINQKLKQYLQFFMDHRQKNWSEQLALAEFAINNKIYSVTKISPFIASYGRKLRIEVDIWKKKKLKKITEFIERMKKIQKEAGAVLKKYRRK